jgi:hypothetical protein
LSISLAAAQFFGQKSTQQTPHSGVKPIIGDSQRDSHLGQPGPGMGTQEGALLRSQTSNQAAIARCPGLRFGGNQVAQKGQFNTGVVG